MTTPILHIAVTSGGIWVKAVSVKHSRHLPPKVPRFRRLTYPVTHADTLVDGTNTTELGKALQNYPGFQHMSRPSDYQSFFLCSV